MSVFGEAETKQQAEETQVTEQAVETQESFVKKLVEQRGEKWQDPEVIAKGKIEADTHIANLERQLQEMREDLSKNEYSKKLLETLQNKAGGTTQETADAKDNNTGAATETNTTAEVGDIDLESLVEQTLAKREQEAKVAQNIKSVEQQLETAFGTEARKVVEEKAASLGISLNRMQEIASESPAAFMALVGQPAAMERNADVTSAKNTASGFNTQGVKDFDFYQKMRRENPKQYYSPSMQNEMAQARVQLGDKFYRK